MTLTVPQICELIQKQSQLAQMPRYSQNFTINATILNFFGRHYAHQIQLTDKIAHDNAEKPPPCKQKQTGPADPLSYTLNVCNGKKLNEVKLHQLE